MVLRRANETAGCPRPQPFASSRFAAHWPRNAYHEWNRSQVACQDGGLHQRQPIVHCEWLSMFRNRRSCWWAGLRIAALLRLSTQFGQWEWLLQWGVWRWHCKFLSKANTIVRSIHRQNLVVMYKSNIVWYTIYVYGFNLISFLMSFAFPSKDK